MVDILDLGQNGKTNDTKVIIIENKKQNAKQKNSNCSIKIHILYNIERSYVLWLELK